MKTREPSLISCFLYMAEHYWQKVGPRFAESLLSTSAMVGRQKALPLFESVEQNPNASEDILETVRDYRDLILDSPEKWLPESDAFTQLPVNGNENGHSEQPTVVELAYV